MNTLEKQEESKKVFEKVDQNQKIVKSTQKIIQSIHEIDKAVPLLSKHYLFDENHYKKYGREDILNSLCKEFKVSIDYVKKVMNGNRN